MIPILFKLGPFKVGSYGLMLVLAFLSCLWFLTREFKRNGYESDWAFSVVTWAAIGGIVGARVYFIIEHLHEFFLDPLGMIFTGSGLTFYGGLFGGFLGVVWQIHKIPRPNLKIADMIAPLLLLGYGIGRIGCFLSGDGDYGPPSDLPWAMAFPNGLVPTNVPVHPTPVYESLMAVTLFAILWNLRKKNHPPGLMLSGMAVFYGVERFIAEFWRLTPKILWGWMSMAQIISVILVITGILWAWYLLKRKSPKEVNP
ncbi:MAG TPA: prolipoprotein diacylglyceryl transferase [Bacteroidetes bacterium]|nr:prolipoprotein diacylglyceryl transferase [Bacteroidota bacterium]